MIFRRRIVNKNLHRLGEKPKPPYYLGPGTKNGKKIPVGEDKQDVWGPSEKEYIQPRDPETGKYITFKEAHRLGIPKKKNPNYRGASTKRK